MAAHNKFDSKSAVTLEDVPPEFRERFSEVVSLADDFCDRFLNDEYKQICRKMAVSLPLVSNCSSILAFRGTTG